MPFLNAPTFDSIVLTKRLLEQNTSTFDLTVLTKRLLEQTIKNKLTFLYSGS